MTDCIVYSIAVSSPITPSEPLPPLPAIPRGSLVIVEGRAPVVGHGAASAARLARSGPGQPTRDWVRWSWPATARSGRWDRWWM